MKKTMLRDLLLALSMMVCTHVARAALPEDLSEALHEALEESPARDLVLNSLSEIYDQEPILKKKRLMENFVRSILEDKLGNLRDVLEYYQNTHYLRIGQERTIDAAEWKITLQRALQSYEATPKASSGYHFNFPLQSIIHFVNHGDCHGFSLLHILTSQNKEAFIDYAQYRSLKTIPLTELLTLLPRLSETWFHRTYAGLVSGLRSKSVQDRVDRMIFQSISTFFQDHFYPDIADVFLKSIFPLDQHPLKQTFQARIVVPVNTDSIPLHDFFQNILNAGKNIIFSGVYCRPSELGYLSLEHGHAVSITSDGTKFSLLDSNGYSFEVDDRTEFIERMIRWCDITFLSPQETGGKMFYSAMGLDSIVSNPSEPFAIDSRYDPVFKAAPGERFDMQCGRSFLGSCTVFMNDAYFLDALFSAKPEYSSDPFFLRNIFWELQGKNQSVMYAGPKKSILSCVDLAYTGVLTKAKKECALLSAFHIVSVFSEKAFSKDCKKISKLMQQEGDLIALCNIEKEKTLPRVQLFDEVQAFFTLTRDALMSMDEAPELLPAQFNLPEAAAIAKNFKSANIARKTELLKDYIRANREVNA